VAKGNHLQSLGEELAALERDDPAVAEAAASYTRMRDRLLDRGPGLSPSALNRLYDLSSEPTGKSFHETHPAPGLPQEAEREIDSPAVPGKDVSPGQR